MKKFIIASALAMTFSAAMAETPFQFERELGNPDLYVMDNEGQFPNAGKSGVTGSSSLAEVLRGSPDAGYDNSGIDFQSRGFTPYSGDDSYQAITIDNPDLYDGRV